MHLLANFLQYACATYYENRFAVVKVIAVIKGGALFLANSVA